MSAERRTDAAASVGSSRDAAGANPVISLAPSSQAVLESCPDALLVVGEDGTIRMVNAATERMLGYTREELVGQDHRMVVAEGFRSSFHRLFSALRRDADIGALPPVEVYGLRRDGSEFQAEITCSLVAPVWPSPDANPRTDPAPGTDADPGTDPAPGTDADPGTTAAPPAHPHDDVCVAVLVRDTSRRLQADSELRSAMSLLSATLESTADGILVVSRDGQIAGVNNRFTSMWGIPRELLATRDAEAVLDFALDQLVDPAGFIERVKAVRADPAAESHDVLDFRDGRTFERYSRPQLVADEVVGRVWSFRDVSPARTAQDRITQAMADLAEQAAQLKALAFKDPLTGLSNRQLFNERLAAALQGPSGTAVDVLLLDLDDFKEVNDIHGHHAGDQLLVEVGRRLRACVRPDDVVARLGGDEFVILLVGSPDAGAAAERIVEFLKVPLWIDGTMLRPSLSLGLASLCEETVDASELLRRADVAMYAAKAAGKNRYLRFRPEMMAALVERTEMEAGLRMAIDSGQIGVHYQPILLAKHDAVLKVEALARWERDGELVPPGQFIPVAERSGLIMEIGTEVLLTACREMKSWLAEDAARSLAVNVSGVQLQHGDFAEVVLAVAESCGVAPRQLVLEVTESVFFHDDCHVIQQLVALRKAGVRVALDDFGTGYSSLGRLQGLPVDTLKIDQSFVSMIHTGAEKLPILSSMISMAHGLGLTVTAEGVETEKQAKYLLQLECDSLQGFLFSRPEPRPLLEPAIARSVAAFAALRGDRVSGNR
ncbi:diguanylate cyclase (GGDEF)-like protein/PAS domain S-box-containing protein [Arthrobacter sp. B3I9]|uniref:sensor domain-containing protein n=1 Tax=Arthrobacter sp. B3I9 TaxID=3042270 RepID=UPI00278F77B0|nr:EAL domain-containing protein [Arthrobacter sp. B3I9]MDQ0851259.1 diguanylate cyclase (GGDEF)-like protein/PAS domain S-box-containing protein [Arthrobacter sp. B3I9]